MSKGRFSEEQMARIQGYGHSVFRALAFVTHESPTQRNFRSAPRLQ